MNMSHLRNIRKYELDQIVPLFSQGNTVLEIGAGAGWQAKALVNKGFSVEAIDLAESNYAGERIWPVLEYDGRHIPFPDNHFDIIFSSNVLEHIPHVENFQSEMQRVLKPEGFAIHVLPTGSWRFWTNVSFYLTRLQVVLFLMRSRVFKKSESISDSTDRDAIPSSSQQKVSLPKKLVSTFLIPSAHGPIGNSVSQIYFFSRLRWKRLFRRTGWTVKLCRPVGLFHTGYLLFGPLLSISARHLMSYFLGSSCLLYVLHEEKPCGGPGQKDSDSAV